MSLILVVTMLTITLVSCGTTNNANGNKETEAPESATQVPDESKDAADDTNKDGYELALITDVGTIDDKSFNQGSWEGVEKYAKEKGISAKYYKPAEKSDEALLNAITLAVKGGAKFVVCPGYLFEVAVFNAQQMYPDVTFLILDGEPHNGDYNHVITENTSSIFYAEEQAGFLAGYAAVIDGYKNLGFMGGIAVPAVIRFGYGYIQGAEYAANELGLQDNEIDMKYTYVGNFDASPDNMTIAAGWYKNGTEVIFGCGGGVGNSVMKAAETANKKVIGVDVDQSSESETVITSAMKNLQKSVYDAIATYYEGNYPGGKSLTLDVTTESIKLPMDTSRFTTFNQAKYDEIYAKLVSGEIKVKDNTAAENADGLETKKVKVSVIK